MLYSDYRLTEPKLYYFQTDHLGTPLEVTDTHGKLAWVGHYRAWGKLDKARDGNGSPAVTDNPFRFQGQYHDEETGLHYNRHRYYDPEVGRFTTQDPIGLAGGENLYQYAPNPTGWVDPLGLSKNCCDVLDARVKDVHDALDPIARNRRTTAGLDTAEGERILSAGGRDLNPAQRAAMLEGETTARLPGAHAEVTALEHASQSGLTPTRMSVSRRICSNCAEYIEQTGGRLTSPTTVEWPQ